MILKNANSSSSSSRKKPLSSQSSSEQEDAQSRSQENRRCCQSIITLRHAYPLSRLSVQHLLRDFHRKLSIKTILFYPITDHYFNGEPMNITKIKEYSKKKLNSTFTTKIKTNKYTRRLRYTWRTLLKSENTKKTWSIKYQRINTQPIKTKTTKCTRKLRYIMSTWITIN